MLKIGLEEGDLVRRQVVADANVAVFWVLIQEAAMQGERKSKVRDKVTSE